jgi:aminoglycoside 6-adenylyltransferase
MRSPETVFAQLSAFAQGHAAVRLLLLTGSRANPLHAPDLLSDYDVVVSVTGSAPDASGDGWLATFGSVLLQQRPESPPGTSTWLVVFSDGTRIDFTFAPCERVADALAGEPYVRVLLDKDGRGAVAADAPQTAGAVGPPTAEQFAACCNEFWWVAPYVAKGLWRGQIPYARHTFEWFVRAELERMLVWRAAHAHGWRWNPGGYNKHLQSGLPADLWAAYLRTCADAGPAAQWAALEAACDLMHEVAHSLAAALGYTVDAAEEAGSRALIAAIRSAAPNTTTLALE